MGLVCVALAMAAVCAAPDGEFGEQEAALLPALGLDMPPGPIAPAQGQCVATVDADAQPVVGRLLAFVGQTRIVMLPDGQLAARSADQAKPTPHPFEPATKAAVAARLRAASLPGFQSTETRRYLYLYNCSEPFAQAASRILETMFRGVVGYAQVHELTAVVPEVPLVVIIFRTADEFQAFRRMPEDTVAYYDVLSNHVVMYEESRLWQIKPELATAQAIATIAHEGAHQILHNIGVQQRLARWPTWLEEGLAEYLAPTTTDRQLKWKGVGQANDLRLFELEQWLANRSPDDADGQLVAQTVGAVRLTSTGYAAAWALTNYLARHQREAFHEFIRQTSRLGPLENPGRVAPPGVLPDNVRRFKEAFGDDLAALERRLILSLKQMPYVDPFADWPHFVAVVSAPSSPRLRRDVGMFRAPEQADRWRREYIDQTPEPLRASIQSAVHPFPNRALAEAFARRWMQGN